MAKRILKKSKWLRQLFACLLILAMVPAPMSAYAAGGAGISTVVSGAGSIGISVDSNGNLYYMSYVDAGKNSSYINTMSSGGDVTRMAGGGTLAGGGMANGVDADKAFICNPWKTVLYDGELYFSDTGSMRIRKISGGKVYNVVGNGMDYSDHDGTLTDMTSISNPRGMAFDKSGNLYFAEAGGYRVRMVSADRGTIETVAGNGNRGFSGNGGPASAAEFEIPSGIAFDASENLYIADPGNQVIWEVAAVDHTQYGIDMQAGCIYIVVGGGDVSGEGIQANGARMYWPRDVIVDDSGNLYISELHRVRKISTDGVINTIAGQTDSGNSGDGGDAADALFNNPMGLALDSDGNLLVADAANERIRKIILSPAPESDLAITTDSLPDGSVGTTYCAKLAATGGTGNYTWSASGGVPIGMRCTVDGYLRGMPASSGTYHARITVTDDNSETTTRTIALTIAPQQDSPLSHWTERNVPASLTDIPIYDIAYGGGTFMGVGGLEGIMTSPDGTAWTVDADQTPAQNYHGVAYGEGTFVAVGQKMGSGIIITKIAGSGFGAWTDKTPASSGSLESVAYAGNHTFIAVGNNTVLLSSDLGDTWSAAALPSLDNGVTFVLHGVSADENGHAVAVGTDSRGQSLLWYSSDNGRTWSATASRIEGTGLNSVACGNGTFVAVGNDGTAYLSGDDGNTWEYSELPGSLDDVMPVMNKIAFGGNTFVAVGQCGDGQYNVVSSSDNGVTWTGRYSKPDTDFQALAYGNNSFVNAGYTTGQNEKMYQSDPLTSVPHETPTVVTGTVTGITASGATLNGNVTAGGSAAVTARGFVYGLSANPENDGMGVTQIAAGSGTGGFNAVLTGLTANTTYHVRAYASNSEGTSYGTDVTFTTLAAQDNSGSDGNSHSGSGGGGTVQPENPTVRVMDSGGNLIQSITAMLDSSKGTASVEVSSALLNDAFDKSKTNEKGMKTVEIDIPKIDGVKAYESTLPASFLTSGDPSRKIEIKTDIASVTMPGNMVSAVNAAGAQKISLAIATGDKSKLEAAVQSQIGDRPVIELALKVDGKQTSWSNEMAPVTVSIPYTPTAAELKDQEHIVIWYINGSGNVISVPNGHYDPSTGTVTFTTTHFSRYAVAYVHQTFGDLSSVEWARKSIEVMASKGIIKGTGENIFSPSANITRADYLVLLVKTLGLTANLDGNFDDVQPGAYYYEAVGIAKKLGIATGSGNNHFNPKENITRQDMMTLTAHALEEFKEMRTASDTAVLDQFSDKDDIAGYAKGSLEMFVKNGLISGSGDKLNPLAYTTRAEAAVFLYRINSMQ